MLETDLALADKKLLFKEGDEAREMLLVKSGRVLCLKKSKDRLIPIFMAKEQDIIGESSMLENNFYQYSAVAIGHVETISINDSEFQEAFKKSPEWIRNLSELMITRHANTSNLIAENRVLSPLIVSDEEFTAEIEVELKKLIS